MSFRNLKRRVQAPAAQKKHRLNKMQAKSLKRKKNLVLSS